MKKAIALLCFAFTCSFIWSQKNPDAVLMTLENEKITVRDFEYIFKKNSADESVTKQSLDEYIELFINYKLKVLAAKDAKLDTNQAFISELAGYRKQLARPYLTDGELLDQLTLEAYDRKKQEVHARHILVRVAADASPEDTLKAWNKIAALKQRIEAGEDFVKVAQSKGGSEDPSVKDNGGDLGFFSAFQMVYPFEEAAYNTEVGNISNILRTRYGYHILEVLEKRNARGQIKVAHIMTKAPANSNQTSLKRAQDKIFEIHEKYKGGESFENLARMFSEDASSSKSGGELPWFGTRKMVKSFEDVCFELENIGDVSEPFQTEYGWHIVKKLDEKVIGDFDELKSEIKSKVSKDSRADVTKKSFLKKLKNDYTIKTKSKPLKFLYKSADSTFFTKEWEMNYPKKLSKKMMVIDGKRFNLADFNKYLIKKKRRARNVDANEFIKSTFNQWQNDELLNYEDSKLEEKHEAFRLLMREYKDGILLFELTDQLVWSKAIKDTTGLKEFFHTNSQNYMWPIRYQAEIYEMSSSDIATQVLELLNQGLSQDSISKIINKESTLNLRAESGLYTMEDKEFLFSSGTQTEGVSEIIKKDGKLFIVNIVKIIPTTQKELSDTKGLVTSDYQNYLEKEWIASLRAKYKYSVDKDILYSIADE